MTIRRTDPTAITRVYPHLNEIKSAEWPTAQSLRLLWDRVHDLTEQVTAANATITQLVAGHNTNEASLASVTQDARQALALSQQVSDAGATLVGGGPGISPAPGGDGGGGSIGCAAAGSTGHDTGGLLNPVRAGQIVCGTANEFPALLLETIDQATRDANAEALLRRMIWHLRQAGFVAGRQKNPSGAISQDKLTVVVDEVLRAYEVFVGKHRFAFPMTTSMRVVTPATMVDDEGIPD